MNPWSQVWLLAKREFIERGRSKPFMITMAILAVGILAIGPIVSALSGGEPEATVVGLLGTEPPGIEAELVAQGDLFGIEIEVVRHESNEEAEAALENGGVAAVLVNGTQLDFYENTSAGLTTLVIRAVDVTTTRSNLEDLGLSEEEIASVQDPAPLSVSTIEDPDPQEEAKRGAAFFGAIALYVSIIMFGQFVAMGTVEEKQNRVVEVVLSRVRTWQVLVGKVAGVTDGDTVTVLVAERPIKVRLAEIASDDQFSFVE